MDRQLAERMVGAACLLAVLVLVVPAILDGNPESGATITHPVADGGVAGSSSREKPLDLRTHTIRLDAAGREPPVPSARPSGNEAPLTLPDPRAPQAAAEPGETDRPPSRPPVEKASGDSATSAAGAEAPAVPVDPKPATPARAEAPAPVKAAPTKPEPVKSVPAKPEAAKPAAGGWMVQLGSFSQRANADRLAAQVRQKGFAASVQGGGGASGTLFRVRVGPERDKAAAEDLARRLAAAGFAGGRVGQQ